MGFGEFGVPTMGFGEFGVPAMGVGELGMPALVGMPCQFTYPLSAIY